MEPAHPRSRGENMAVSLILSALAGSSPLTRGKPRPRLRSRSRQRLIPAHAGKTLTAESCSAASTAHPRSRGENICVHRGPHNGLGSSPLTRGKRNPSTSSAAAARLIPAHAGKTAVGYVVKSAAEAHPRSRGENGRIEVTDRAAPGSSPLTRGKHNHQSPVPHQAAAHPRSRGENGKGVNIAQPRLGSSPLTRGKPLAALITAANSGLIPAHAGKTSVGHCAIGCHWAHPRSRGENRVAVYEVTQTGGSSPLTRGKLSLAMHISSIPRLIPAHAGKTTLTASPRGSATAHPRSRGENRCRRSDGVDHAGSSPLTRGKQAGQGSAALPGRLIPAHAGKTMYST